MIERFVKSIIFDRIFVTRNYNLKYFFRNQGIKVIVMFTLLKLVKILYRKKRTHESRAEGERF